MRGKINFIFTTMTHREAEAFARERFFNKRIIFKPNNIVGLCIGIYHEPNHKEPNIEFVPRLIIEPDHWGLNRMYVPIEGCELTDIPFDLFESAKVRETVLEIAKLSIPALINARGYENDVHEAGVEAVKIGESFAKEFYSQNK